VSLLGVLPDFGGLCICRMLQHRYWIQTVISDRLRRACAGLLIYVMPLAIHVGAFQPNVQIRSYTGSMHEEAVVLALDAEGVHWFPARTPRNWTIQIGSDIATLSIRRLYDSRW